MPQVRFAPGALRDLQRVREFLSSKSPEAAYRAGHVIRQGVRVLALQPAIGRTVRDLPDQFREWPIDFGKSGYIARYRIDADGSVTILAIRHQREVGFDANPAM